MERVKTVSRQIVHLLLEQFHATDHGILPMALRDGWLPGHSSRSWRLWVIWGRAEP